MMGIGFSAIFVTEVKFSLLTLKKKRVSPKLKEDTMYMSRFVSETDYFALTFADEIFNETLTSTYAQDLSSPKKKHAILFRH